MSSQLSALLPFAYSRVTEVQGCPPHLAGGLGVTSTLSAHGYWLPLECSDFNHRVILGTPKQHESQAIAGCANVRES